MFVAQTTAHKTDFVQMNFSEWPQENIDIRFYILFHILAIDGSALLGQTTCTHEWPQVNLGISVSVHYVDMFQVINATCDGALIFQYRSLRELSIMQCPYNSASQGSRYAL